MLRSAVRGIGVCVLALVLLSACGAAEPATTTQNQTVDGLTIALTGASQALMNTQQEFLIELRDSSGQPIDGAEVYLDLVMPAMPMGSNQPVAAAQGQGRYRATSAYTMSGSWEIAVVASVAGKEYRATFPREVVEP